MIDLVNFGSLTRTSKVVSNPISNSFNFSSSVSNSSIFSNTQKDEKEYKQAESSTVAYANPFAFLNDSSDNSEVSAFAA
jgi:hypothetical protein